MSFKVLITGARLGVDRLDLADELEESYHRGAKERVAEAAGLLLAEVQRNLRLRAGTFKTAAPEGQPPEFDHGGLYRSFKIIPPKVKGRTARSGVQSDDPGAARLEWGATDSRGIRTLPHPYLLPAMAAVEEAVTALIEKGFGE